MEVVFSLLAGVLMSASVWLMLSRNLVKFLFGLVLISNVANLVIFTTGGLTYGIPPFIGDHGPVEGYANPLPQALILTAIVIGFGLTSFTLVLAMRAYREIGTVHVDDMTVAEQRKTFARGPVSEHPHLSRGSEDEAAATGSGAEPSASGSTDAGMPGGSAQATASGTDETGAASAAPATDQPTERCDSPGSTDDGEPQDAAGRSEDDPSAGGGR